MSSTLSLARELRQLSKNPIPGIRILVSDSDIRELEAELSGPEDTPYEGGTFRIKLVFGPEFPSQPPKGLFLTRIFHPNVSESGEICVNALKRDWTPQLGLSHILAVIRCLLIEPNPESALNEEAGKLLLESYEQYFKRASMLTKLYSISSENHQENKKSDQQNSPDENHGINGKRTVQENAVSGKKKVAKQAKGHGLRRL